MGSRHCADAGTSGATGRGENAAQVSAQVAAGAPTAWEAARVYLRAHNGGSHYVSWELEILLQQEGAHEISVSLCC